MHFQIALRFLLKALLAFVTFTIPSLADTTGTSGNFTYSDNGTSISITGWVTKPTGALVIPPLINGKPVTSIENYAFDGCVGLTSVTIPISITTMGDGAFFNCGGLASVAIPSSVTSIGNYVFDGCHGLTSITIPSSVISIGQGAFQSCTGLTSVTIPSSVTSIGDGAFKYCSGLMSVTIPSSVTSIDGSAFGQCTSLTSATFLGNAPTAMGGGTFSSAASGFTVYYFSGRTGFTSPAWTTSAGDVYPAAQLNFNYTDNGASITITGYVTEPTGAMVIPSAIIGKPVTSIGIFAFSSCANLTSVAIPFGVTSIGASTFADCNSLTSVAIPSSVTSIGAFAFLNCHSLTNVAIPTRSCLKTVKA